MKYKHIVFFGFCFLIYFNLINLFYNSTLSPDYFAYQNYFDTFFGNKITSGRENGVIYFYLVTLVFNQFLNFQGPYSTLQFISNSILIVNGILFIIGISGLVKLLNKRGFDSKSIYLGLTIAMFSPVSLKLITTFKPEIYAFAFFTWLLFYLEKFFENYNKKYLSLSIFPLLNILNTKGTIILSIFILLIFLLVKYKYYSKFLFLLSLTLLALLFPLLIENHSINGYFIFDHHPTKIVEFNEENWIGLDFLYNINFKELISYPFKDTHANSFIGIFLLDSFGDYFKWYQNNAQSLFSINRFNLNQFWIFTHWIEYLSIVTSILFLIGLTIYTKKNKYDYLHFLFLFGLLSLLIIAYSSRATYDIADSELFKSHYYSYLMFVSEALIATYFFSKVKLKFVSFFTFLLTFLIILGFPKTENSEYNLYLNTRNSSAIFCSINNKIIKNLESDCFDKITLICNEDPIISDVRFIKYLDSYNFAKEKSIFPIPFQKESNVFFANNVQECEDLVTQDYFFVSNYKNLKLFPTINFLYFLLGLISILLYKNKFLIFK